jgi:hypothetical protein
MARQLCYLRVEGVNLGNFVYDVEDLSTVRGGGLLMLDVPRRIEALASKRGLRLVPISAGASSGLYSLEIETDKLDEVAAHLRTDLQNDSQLRHATIVVDAIPKGDDFVQDLESVIALNRWRQMRAPSLAVPGASKAGIPCKLDGVRPAESTTVKGTETVAVSRSVKVRRDHGREAKNAFYLREIRRDAQPHPDAVRVAESGFVQDLQDLTDERSKGNLHHKMAVVYFDGNGFGKLQARLCRTPANLKRFDSEVREDRRTALEALLRTMAHDADGWTNHHPKEPKHPQSGPWRLETLLWGGDELIWVVPAWQGWRTVQLFYEVSATWTFEGEPLTHGGGVVFCHHNAPIHRIGRLVQELAGKAKTQAAALSSADPRTRNRFAYQTLESFDFTGSDLEKFRERRIPNGGSTAELILPGAGMKEIESAFASVKARFPRGKLHEIVLGLRSARKEDIDNAHDLIKGTLADVLVNEGIKGDLDSMRKYFGAGDVFWFHLLDLWDYIPAPRLVPMAQTMAQTTAREVRA